MHEVHYRDIEDDTKAIFIDVRSPGEFKKETIPGAINVPLFDNKERELIGTLYKKESVEEAKKTGVEIASKKLPIIYEKISSLSKGHNHIYMFCSRGGFRSSSLSPFFEALNINVTKLHGGYKEYRAHIRDMLPILCRDLKLIVLYGNTGTGKTHILEHLKSKEMNVLDLEGAANHRGSILGSVGLGEANSQKMFESLVYEQLKNRSSDLVFVEGESKRVGRSLIPEYLFNKMHEGASLKIIAPLEKRVDIILEDYISGDDEDIIEALNHMRNRLGNLKVDEYIEMVKNKDYRPVISDLFANYYDPLYQKHSHDYVKTFENLDSNKTAENIIAWVEEKKMEL